MRGEGAEVTIGRDWLLQPPRRFEGVGRYAVQTMVSTAHAADGPALGALVDMWDVRLQEVGEQRVIGPANVRVLRSMLPIVDPATGEEIDPETFRYVTVEGPVIR